VDIARALDMIAEHCTNESPSTGIPFEFDMDEDFDTENAKYKATARYSVGWTDPRGLYASMGA
jgi:hypothetical protein